MVDKKESQKPTAVVAGVEDAPKEKFSDADFAAEPEKDKEVEQDVPASEGSHKDFVPEEEKEAVLKTVSKEEEVLSDPPASQGGHSDFIPGDKAEAVVPDQVGNFEFPYGRIVNQGEPEDVLAERTAEDSVTAAGEVSGPFRDDIGNGVDGREAVNPKGTPERPRPKDVPANRDQFDRVVPDAEAK